VAGLQHNESDNSAVNGVDIGVAPRLRSPNPTRSTRKRGALLPADVLFTGGAVFTGTGEPLHGHAVVVTGDRITAVVPESEASAHVGEATRVVDLGGALLSPGFQDAHVHPLSAGV
jgi:imidazolonepropionase-like amidohydrolase